MKLTRGAYRTFLDSTFGGSGTPKWWRIGKYNDSMSVALNPDVSTSKNIWDETYVEDNGYEPSVEDITYYADPTDAIYPMIRDIAMNRLRGDECKTTILEVIIEDTEKTNHLAWTEDVVIKTSEYGGGTDGFTIPFSIYFDGNRKKGYVTIESGTPAFKDGEIPLT